MIVYADGKICLDILQNKWTSLYSIQSVLISVRSLLSDPNPESPANQNAAEVYEKNKEEYYRRVRATVENSWEFIDLNLL